MNIIDVYSRKQAIKDGTLIEAPTDLTKEVGIKFPVAVTSRLFHEWIVPTDIDRKYGQSEEGRMWDVLTLFRFYAKRTSGDTMFYPCYFIKNKKRYCVKLKSVIHPGDDYSPVITIMLEDED